MWDSKTLKENLLSLWLEEISEMRATTVMGKQGGDPGEPAVEGKSNN